jgi:hypothetical protein
MEPRDIVMTHRGLALWIRRVAACGVGRGDDRPWSPSGATVAYPADGEVVL